MTRPEGSKEELEARRKEAVKLLERGASVPEVAELKDVTLKSVYRWKETYDEEGLEGLDAIPNTGGRDPKLPEEKLPELEELLLDGAEAHGFEGDLWTLSRVATIIEREFDKSLSTSSARRYLEKLDWSNQRPQRRAAKRDPDEIEQWREEWEYRQKKPSTATKR